MATLQSLAETSCLTLAVSGLMRAGARGNAAVAVGDGQPACGRRIHRQVPAWQDRVLVRPHLARPHRGVRLHLCFSQLKEFSVRHGSPQQITWLPAGEPRCKLAGWTVFFRVFSLDMTRRMRYMPLDVLLHQ